MSNHAQIAKGLFEEGYNCAQSVFAAFCDETGLDKETALRLASPLGGGVGRLREMCGAVTGMLMAMGTKLGYATANDDEAKTQLYCLTQSLALRFKEKNGSYICRDLLGLDEGIDNPVPQARTKEYYQTRPCAELVAYAASLLDEQLEKERENTKHEENCGGK